MKRLEIAFMDGNIFAKDILKSYANAEFFTNLPDISEEIEIVTYVAGIGIFLQTFYLQVVMHHSRSDRELHSKSVFEHNVDQQNELLSLKKKHLTKL